MASLSRREPRISVTRLINKIMLKAAPSARYTTVQLASAAQWAAIRSENGSSRHGPGWLLLADPHSGKECGSLLPKAMRSKVQLPVSSRMAGNKLQVRRFQFLAIRRLRSSQSNAGTCRQLLARLQLQSFLHIPFMPQMPCRLVLFCN